MLNSIFKKRLKKRRNIPYLFGEAENGSSLSRSCPNRLDKRQNYHTERNIKMSQESQTTAKLCRKVHFLWSALLKDLLHIPYKIKLIFAIRPYTGLSYPKLSNLYEIAFRMEREKIRGSFVECGVKNGGSAGVIAAIAKKTRTETFGFLILGKVCPNQTSGILITKSA